MFNYPLSVFLDTNTFKKSRYDLNEKGLLFKLKNLVVRDEIKLYTSNIAVRETESHIKLDISESIGLFNKTRKDISKKISPSIVESSLLYPIFEKPSTDTIEQNAIRRFRDFLNEANVIVLDNEGININLIIDDYFNCNPPFESKKEKKYEFPDALMISKLKTEFNKDKPVCIISSDEGFKKAFSNKEGYTCLSSINELLDFINKQDKIMYYRIEKYINLNKEEICNELKKKIESDDIYVEGLDSDKKGCTGGYDYIETFITNACVENYYLKSVDEINGDFIYLTITCEAKVTASCFYYDYDNALWDSDEKEYLFLSKVENEEEHEPKFECNLTLEVDDKDNCIEFSVFDVSYNLTLDQSSRVKRSEVEPEDPSILAEAEAMDALEEYYKH